MPETENRNFELKLESKRKPKTRECPPEFATY